jgi:hypothetical protein
MSIARLSIVPLAFSNVLIYDLSNPLLFNRINSIWPDGIDNDSAVDEILELGRFHTHE